MANTHQYQSRTNPAYYHRGIDLLLSADQKIHAPVSGIIDGGYYAYRDYPDGSMDKLFLPLSNYLLGERPAFWKDWGKKFFEVAIIDKHGNRFEIHHVDLDTLPEELFQKILKGGEKIKKGSFLGKSVPMGKGYKGINTRHIHYNIVDPNGHYINPAYYSKTIKDTTAPLIHNIYRQKTSSACSQHLELVPLTKKKENVGDYLIVETTDHIQDGLIPIAPVVVKATFKGRSSFTWDFSKHLSSENTPLANIQDVYLAQRCLSAINTYMRASSSINFYFKIPVPKGFSGQVNINVQDQNGNQDSKKLNIIHSP